MMISTSRTRPPWSSTPPTPIDRHARGRSEIERDHRDRGGEDALDLRDRSLRQLDVIDRRAAGVLRRERIGLVGELERELGAAADRLRADVAHARDHRQCLLERPGDLRLHEIGRELRRVRDDHHPREAHLRVDAARQRRDRVHACEREADHGEPDDRRVPAQPADDHGVFPAGGVTAGGFSAAAFPAGALSASFWPSSRPST